MLSGLADDKIDQIAFEAHYKLPPKGRFMFTEKSTLKNFLYYIRTEGGHGMPV
jgi:hypothetical protein